MTDLPRLVSEHIAPQRDAFRTAGDLPSAQHLLGRALAERRIGLKRITEGRWVFTFGGTIIGGWANGVTTLVSAHGRRVLSRPSHLAAHLDLMEVPHRVGAEQTSAGDSDADAPEALSAEPETEGAEPLTLEIYAAGRRAVSVLALVDRERLPDARPEDPQTIAVDVTELAADDLKQLGVDALRAVPGVLAGAVTVSAPSLDSAEDAAVLDVSAEASPLPHHFPTLGPGRPVSSAIAEQILATAAV